MPTVQHPFAVPRALTPDLERVRAYWEGLKRARAAVPFWDDLNLADLPDLGPKLLVIDVFQSPERFRFAVLGKAVASDQAEEGRFLDEATFSPPFDYLRSQCAATVEAAAPTAFKGKAAKAYTRLLLPLWGEGQIRMLLGVVDQG